MTILSYFVKIISFLRLNKSYKYTRKGKELWLIQQKIKLTRETLKQYALRALGKALSLKSMLMMTSLEDRLDEALQYFAQYHYDGIRRTYLKYQYTEADKTRLTGNASESVTKNSVTTSWTEGNNFLIVPESVISVINIFRFLINQT